MADEISASLGLSINDLGNVASGSATFNANISGGIIGNEQIVGTSDETVLLGDVTSIKTIFIKNVDDSNFVQVDNVSTYDNFPQKLYPGEAILLQPESSTIHVKADTAPVKIWVVAG